MDIRFYPYDFTYKVRNDTTYMYLFARGENGEKIIVRHEHLPAFFATSVNINKVEFEKRLATLQIDAKGKVANVLKYEIVKKDLLGETKEFYKITVNYPKAVPLLAKQIQEWGITCYERDILFTHRYIRDMGIVPMTLVEAEGDFIDDTYCRVPVFAATSVKQLEKKAREKWNVLAIDIETYAHSKEIDMIKNPILMIAFYGNDSKGTIYKNIITWKDCGHPDAEVLNDEKAMLERFVDILKQQQPDIVTGYFTDGFDFPYIQERCEKWGVKLNIGIDGSSLYVRKRQGFRDSEAKIAGMLHLDVLKFVKNIFGKNMKTDSYSLNSVANELLGSTKHDVNLDELSTAWDKEDQTKLKTFCNYNLQDTKLTYELCDMLLFDMIEFGKIVGVPVYDVIRMKFSRLVESYILKRAMEFTVLAPNKPGDDELAQRMNESIKGGFVYQPQPGLYDDVVVFDFRSLYPTIITSHNISPESFKKDGAAKIEVPGMEGYWFSTTKAFLPRVLENLITMRMELKEKIATATKAGKDVSFLEARSYAYKILANSFYGYLAFYGARWYSIESAASTTALARHYIQDTIGKAETKGFKVVYGDTDSCFFTLDGKTVDDSLQFMESINKDLPGLMELEFEGYFPHGIFVAMKGVDKGAKKKYALIRKDGSLKITGFETVRRNWSKLAKDVQAEVLQLVLSGKKDDAIVYVKKVIRDLEEGIIENEVLLMRTQLTRELSKYKALSPHVMIARKLVEKGEPVHVGMIIEYVVAKGSGLVRDRATLLQDVPQGGYDANYYITHQIIPAVSQILAVFGVSEDSLLGKAEQKGLGSFF
ncbi:TPA: hypothetical protein HA278_00275 [Candidatus Woesearchaeota archaeon]|nr:hypothetical protein [archaeon]HIJ10464.1 hypothetical protein [Candidatus Woesearchaeota archaeon]